MTQSSRLLLVHLNTTTTHTAESSPIPGRICTSSSSPSFEDQESSYLEIAETVGTFMETNQATSNRNLSKLTELPQGGSHTGQVKQFHSINRVSISITFYYWFGI